jgi:ankyrin repeat protein
MQTGLFEDYLSKMEWEGLKYGYLINNETFLANYINSIDRYGYTILLSICIRGHLPDAKKIIKNSANVNCQTPEEKTTPLIAILKYRFHADNYELARMLLDAGANPLLKDSNGLTALDYAKGREDILELLKKYIK